MFGKAGDRGDRGISPFTDRQSQVMAYMMREQPLIVHMFDVWHVAKGMHYATIIVHDLKNCLY